MIPSFDDFLQNEAPVEKLLRWSVKVPQPWGFILFLVGLFPAFVLSAIVYAERKIGKFLLRKE